MKRILGSRFLVTMGVEALSVSAITLAILLGTSDAAVKSPYLVKDIKAGGGHSNPISLAVMDGFLYFGADDGSAGSELWKTDGSEPGTTIVKDINSGDNPSNPYELTVLDHVLLFRAEDGIHGRELWTSDGTAPGTHLVLDINAGLTGSFAGGLTRVGDQVFFHADDGVHGRELWQTNGTPQGTAQVRDIHEGSASAYPEQLTGVAGQLYFRADDGVHGRELWKSDGRAVNTTLVKDIKPGGNGSDPSGLMDYGGSLFFTADDGVHGHELWRSDGTEGGTVLVMDINPGSDSSYPSSLVVVGNTLYFKANDGTHGYELWKSKGTAASTAMVKDIKPDGGGTPTDLIDLNGSLFFSADDGTHGRELWRSDGTASDTVQVKDINPGSAASYPYNLGEVAGMLLFSADDGTHGFELWLSDGQEAGSKLVQDIRSGEDAADPWYLTELAGMLLFRADDGIHGRELWAWEVPVPDLYIEKAVEPRGPVRPGALVTFTLAFGNEGDAAARDVIVGDVLPAELSEIRVSSSRTITPTGAGGLEWDVGHLFPGQACTITISGIVVPQHTAGYAFTNTAAIGATTEQSHLANDDDSAGLSIDFPPAAANDAYTTLEDTPLVVSRPGVLANDADPEGKALVAALDAPPAIGHLVLQPDGSFRYAPPANYHGSLVFSYHVHDGLFASNIASVTLTVTAQNDAPVARGDDFQSIEDSVLAIAPPGVLENDSDVEGGQLSAIMRTPPSMGTLTLNPDGSFVYDPAEDSYGVLSFTYRASDGEAYSHPAVVTLTLTATNDPPVAADDRYATVEDRAFELGGPGVLANDSDVDGDILTAFLDTPTVEGSLNLATNGSVTYLPPPDLCGTVTFTYHAYDGAAESSEATVKIDILPENDPPQAQADRYRTLDKQTLSVPGPGVLANDFDKEGDALSAVLVDPPQQGSVVLYPDGSLLYTPTVNYAGLATFSYRAYDGDLLSAPAAVTVTIRNENEKPMAEDDEYELLEDSSLEVAAPGVLANDSDGDGDALVAVLGEAPEGGVLELLSDGSLSFAAPPDFYGRFVFTYHSDDGFSASEPALVTLTIEATNDAPIAVADAFAGTWNGALIIPAPGVLANDFDVDGDSLTVVLDTTPVEGDLLLSSDGSFVYTPTQGFDGVLFFVYHADDGQACSNKAIVSVNLRSNAVYLPLIVRKTP